ncbi:hypothetical protein INR49_002713 [Caranx melampygus]|nr:hypothetical protein INR49_002713 [Caranx melampygus]
MLQLLGRVEQTAERRLSSTPNTNPQQPDTGDERSRQACKRGVPSRPACLSDCPAELRAVNAKHRRGPDEEKSIFSLRRPPPPPPD